MPKTAFVTGATGCIGRQLVEELVIDGWAVVILLLPQETDPFAELPSVRSVVGDVNDLTPGSIPKGSVVFHLAAKVHTTPKTSKERQQFLAVNRDGTANLARVAVERQAKGFVFVSTVAVYGKRVEVPGCDEEAETRPVSTYGESKLEAEERIRDILTGRVPYVILRPCVVYGPSDKGNFGSLIKWVVNNKLPVLMINGGKAQKNILYVRTLVRVLIYFGTNICENNGQVFNVADPAAMTMRGIVETVAEAAGINVRLLNVPFWLLKPFAVLGDILGRILGREVPLCSRKLEVMTADAVVDTSKLHSRLRGCVDFTSIKDGLSQLPEICMVKKQR